MKRTLIRVCALILTVMMLTSSAAFAIVSRGDRGTEVYDLQQLLFETGWLFEFPDGIFGGRTEEAVKGFEEFANLPVDGIADDQMIYELCVSLEVLNEEHGIVSDYFGEYPSMYFGANYMGIDYSEGDIDYSYEKDAAEYPVCCVQSTEADGSSRTEYCEKHHELHVDTNDMLVYGDVVSVCMASEMWLEEVGSLYDAWAVLASEEERGAILANRATFLASVEAQRMVANMGTPSEEKTMKTETGICQTLRNQAAWICRQIWEAQSGGNVDEAGDVQELVVLNASVIIDGDSIYYAGNIAGEGDGVYVMNADGSDCRRLADIEAVLMAASNGNLLVWRYGDESGEMGIVHQDGRYETVFYSYCRAIAHDGQFYFGGSSIADDGSDHQWLLSSDPERHDNYYPVKAVDGYLYYFDANVGGLSIFNEGSRLSGGNAEFNRLNLETGEIELLSGAGTNYLDIDDGMLYYTREDFTSFDYESGGSFVVDVDDGVYSMNLEVLGETQIAEISNSDPVYEYCVVYQDEVVYAEYSDYADDEAVYKVLRRHVGGDELPALDMGGNSTLVLCVKDDVLYGIQGVYLEEGEYGSYKEYIVAYDLQTGEMSMFAIGEGVMMCYTDGRPRMAVENDRIYYYVQAEADGAEALVSMALDGSDVRTLIQGAPLY